MGIDEHALVIVPGYGNSGPEHWQTLLEQSHDKALRVVQENWNRPLRGQWAKALDRAVQNLESPSILVGHSAGAMTIVHWASRAAPSSKVVGALLVAPPDMEASLPGMPPAWTIRLAGWAPIPLKRLPWKSIVVASSNDPMCSIARSQEFARAWGSQFVDLGPAGHINADAGFGDWPQARSLIESLAA